MVHDKTPGPHIVTWLLGSGSISYERSVCRLSYTVVIDTYDIFTSVVPCPDLISLPPRP